MKRTAAIAESSVARRSLERLSLPPWAPPLGPVNEIDLELVEYDIAFESTQSDADRRLNPGFEFDRTRFDDWDPDEAS